jgi:O-acetyl-ADP-ribose deacetylase (regulator of RNase III)
MPTKRLQITHGDITTPPASWKVDAIVNAANHSLYGGGGVDGAIHRAAGSRLLEFTRTLGGCETGEVKHSPAFDLEHIGIKHIFHAVGPIWIKCNDLPNFGKGERVLEDDQLAACYRHALALAAQYGARHLAFPAISTGTYGFPKKRAARLALTEIHRHLAENELPEKVSLVFFDMAEAKNCRQIVCKNPDWSWAKKIQSPFTQGR